VFSYVMLGAGFFATQKSQEVTYSGIKQSTSNLVIDGQVYGKYPVDHLTEVTMSLSIPEGGQPQDAKLIAYVVTTNGEIKAPGTIQYAETGTESWTNVGDLTDSVIPAGGKIDVRIPFDGPSRGGSFTIEVKPSIGAASLITKTISTGWNGGVII